MNNILNMAQEVKASTTEVNSTTYEAVKIEKVKAFPISVFPKEIQEAMNTYKKELHYPIDMQAMSFFTVVGTINGGVNRLQIKGSYTASSTFWCMIIGNPGTSKTWPVKEYVNRLLDHDVKNYTEYKTEIEQLNIDIESAQKKDKDKIKRLRDNLRRKQTVATDTTIEALVKIIEANPRGTLLYRDEIKGWLSSFNAYKSGGSDEEQYLELYSNGILNKTRISGTDILIKDTYVSLLGTIQTKVLNGIVNSKNGLVDRFLYSAINTTINNSDPNELPDDHCKVIDSIINNAYEKMNLTNYDGKSNIQIMSLEVRDLYFKYENALNDIMREKTEDADYINNYLSKLKTYLGRFTLVLWFIDMVYYNDDYMKVSINHVSGAFKLVEYFYSTAMAMFGINNKNVELDALLSKMKGKTNKEKANLLIKKGLTKIECTKLLGISRPTLDSWLKV